MSLQRFESDFIAAYIACALWSSTDDDGEPLDVLYDVDDISDETRAEMHGDCLKFLETGAQLIDSDNPHWSGGGSTPYSRAGHDFWLTRNGHGAGFWDGDWPVNGDALDTLSKSFGESDLYIGDDGLLYV